MRRAEALRLLVEHKAELAELGAGSLSLFGSVARDEARSDSDVDVLIEPNRSITLFDLAAIHLRLEEIFGRRVDVATPEGLPPRLRERIARDPTAHKDWTITLEAMLDAAESAAEYGGAVTLADFLAAKVTADATTHCLGMLVHAASRIPDAVRADYPAIDWSLVEPARGALGEDYTQVDLRAVWHVAREVAPKLAAQIKRALEVEHGASR